MSVSNRCPKSNPNLWFFLFIVKISVLFFDGANMNKPFQNTRSVHVMGPRSWQQRSVSRAKNSLGFTSEKLIGGAVAVVFGSAALYGGYTFTDGFNRPEVDTQVNILNLDYRAAYYTTHWTTDSNGNRASYKQYHPEEFLAKVEFPELGTRKTLNITASEYRKVEELANQTHTFKGVYREGRWSGNPTWEDFKEPLSPVIATTVTKKSDW